MSLPPGYGWIHPDLAARYRREEHEQMMGCLKWGFWIALIVGGYFLLKMCSGNPEGA